MITCKVIEVVERTYPRPDPEPEGGWMSSEWVDVATNERPAPGDMFFRPDLLNEDRPGWLAPFYYANNSHRPPITVVLPSGDWFCIDSKATANGELGPEGWTVTGEPPLITVNPSINAVGQWHGWLRAGMLRELSEG